MVGLEETKGAPLATSSAQLIDGTVDFIVAARFEAFATPSACLASTWPKAILGPVVSSVASPTIAILLWAVERKVEFGGAAKAKLPSFVLLGPPLLLGPLLGR